MTKPVITIHILALLCLQGLVALGACALGLQVWMFQYDS